MTRIRTPRRIRTAAQRIQVEGMSRQLSEYRMLEGQNMIRHIIIVCNMMQELIFAGYKGLWTHDAKYRALLNTLLPRDKALLSDLRESFEPDTCFEWIVLLFIQRHRRKEVAVALYPSILPMDIISNIVYRNYLDIPRDLLEAFPCKYRIIR